MTEYITRRIVLMVPVAFLVTIIIFLLIRLAPGDPVLVYAGEERDPEQLAQIRRSLGLAAVLLSSSISLIVGTISALRRNSWIDILATGVTLGGVSLPNFFLGLVLILIFALALRLFPPGGYVPFAQDPLANLHRLLLPAITLATASLAVNLRQV